MRRQRTFAAVLGLSLVVLSACGSDSEPISSGPPVTFATSSTAAAGSASSAGSLAPDDTPVATSPDPSATPDAPAASTTAVAVTAAPATADTTADTTPGAATDTAATTAAPLGDPVVTLVPVVEASSPVDLAWRAGDPTLFVVEQDGLIRPWRDGALGDAVLDISDMTDAGGEQGLLGLTFTADGTRAYINYTDDNGDTRIVEYSVATDGTFEPASRRELLMIEQPYGNHNGGNVTIGPDGYLYVGMGDGGSGGDPERRALNVTTLLGKILRIDPAPAGDAPYTIPPDNPFVGVAGAREEIWSVGVRNPWRMSFDRTTGDLWFGDVGQGDIEEIDVAWADEGAGRGYNFGWSAFEGSERFNEDQPPDGATPPIFEYEHGDAECSVSGGTVYRGKAIPALVGWYVYADYCSGTVFAIVVQDKALVDSIVLGQSERVSAVREGPDGELYVLSTGGTISQIQQG
jgi:glucose/arabinose dehydrogenase